MKISSSSHFSILGLTPLTEEETKKTIKEAFEKKNCLIDTHTAVAVSVYDDYKAVTGDETPTVIASTASPFKFTASVLSAVDASLVKGEEYEMTKTLSEATGVECPVQLTGLENKAVRFSEVIDKADMLSFVKVQ